MYFLSKNCFVGRVQNYWVVLDAGHDRYSCVTHADLASIGGRLHGWRNQNEANEHLPGSGTEANALIESLMSSGIITANPNDGKPFAESACPAYERAMEILDPNVSVKHPPSCVVRFFLACARVDWRLRKRKLSRTLARIEQRRIRARSTAAAGDAPHIPGLMAAFNDLRPLYPRPYLCLFDSLALLEFLAGYHSFPRIVFGVVADPFHAHCWLQEGNTVLNDDLERIGHYRPILSL
jgi:hypothetical protein